MPSAVRRAELADADAIGRLLHDFNTEFDECHARAGEARRADPRAASRRAARRSSSAGEGPDGLAVLRFRPSIWTEGLECYLAELYVAPDRRGHGLGRALMNAAIEAARAEGADYMELGHRPRTTSPRAPSTRASGSRNREGKPDGPVNYFYEREL